MGIGRQMDNWRYPEEGIWILRRLSRRPLIELTAGQIVTAVNVPAWNRLAHLAAQPEAATKVKL